MAQPPSEFRMNRTLLSLALLAASGLAFAQAPARPDIDKVNGSITAEAGQAYGDLSTVNGGIRIASGAQAEDVETVNGGINGEDDIRADSLSTVNGGIRLGLRAQVDGDVETVNGGIFVDRGGRVRGSVGTVNGAIGLVDTDVGGGIETVSGDITVGAGSHVKGGIRVEKPGKMMGISFRKPKVPRVVVGPQAVVEGALVFEREVKLYVHQSARIGQVTGATAQRYSGATLPRD
jgi:DUF4097 and DUF4098 domain-containing protein YvlB